MESMQFRFLGFAEMGPRQKSWVNKAEAEKIVESIATEPRILSEREQSVGVVTPFKPQSLLIQQMLQETCPELDVLVGSAYTFQGDERGCSFCLARLWRKGFQTTHPGSLVGESKSWSMSRLPGPRTPFLWWEILTMLSKRHGVLGDLAKVCSGH